MKDRVSVLQTILMILVLSSGCGPRDKSVAFLKHWIIDPEPNTGKECCTDVLMLGDINGDGNQDVVIGAEHAEGSGLVWYQYPSWEKQPVASGEFTTDGQLADMDRDGDLDIVIGSFREGKGEIFWFENVSGTGKKEWVRHIVGEGYAHDLVAGDVNGDGKMDIVTCNKKKVVLWEQVSPDSWRAHVIAERPGEGIALFDIDGDGDFDIVYGGSWIENPGSWKTAPWVSHPIDPKWSPDTRVFVADMNMDGRPDVVLSVSEGKGPLSWFESPENPKTGVWIEHPIEKGRLEGAHSLQVADMDGDGKLDVITAEMHTSSNKRVLIYLNEGETFIPVVLARKGSHNMRVGDIDNDGDIDIVGKNYAGPGRVIEMWENQNSNEKKWRYISIDEKRPKKEKGKMGLCFTDADKDGFPDVVAGSFLYLNPRGKIENLWERIRLADDIDMFFAIDVNENNLADLIGIAGDTVIWLEAKNEKADSWNTRPIGKVAKSRTQGYVASSLVPGKKPQLIFTRGKNLYVLEIPTNPERDSWPLHLISTENEEEGIAVGDIDGDGDMDIAVVHADGHHAVWLENPGSIALNWKMHIVGESESWLDRIAIADLNGDGRLDIIATEERRDRILAATLNWFESPADPKAEKWTRHVIGRHRSLNSMDLADFDGDGSIDVVVAEHTDQRNEDVRDNLTVVYLNREHGRVWLPRVVERGPHSSHLGAKAIDLDQDGFPEIVSIGWNQYRNVHMWKKIIPGFGRRENKEVGPSRRADSGKDDL